MNVTFDFACRDDCLDLMVPSDLRTLVRQRDRLADLLHFALDRGHTPHDFGPIDEWRDKAHAALAEHEKARKGEP